MKFCQIHTYPESHLHALHVARPHLLDAPFKEHARELAEEAPEATALWTPSLADLGHDAQIIVANDVVSQCRWAAENLDSFKPKKKNDWMQELVVEQLRKMKPEVLFISDPATFDTRFIERIKHRPRWIIGWSKTLSNDEANWRGFDVMLSPHIACMRQAWRKRARDARVFQAGFPRSVTESVFQELVNLDVVYCGKWLPAEEKRIKRITALAKAASRREKPFTLGLFLEVPDGAELPPAVRKLNQGPRHGLARYRAISSARLFVVEEPEQALGDTMPLGVYEGTGIGVCTIIGESAALSSCFQQDKEVVVCRGSSDLVARIDQLLADSAKRTAIAQAGQERCLTQHSMESRMRELVALLSGNPGGVLAAFRRLRHRFVP